MLVHPRPMCPRPKFLGCCNPWTKCPLAILPLTEPSHPFDLIERSDTRLPTAARFSAAKRWSSMCGPSVHPTEGRQSNKPGQGRRRSWPDAQMIHQAPEVDRGRDSSRRSQFHARRSPGSGHIGQGHNIQGTLCSRGATSKNFRSGTHRLGTHQPCNYLGSSRRGLSQTQRPQNSRTQFVFKISGL